MNTSRQLAAAVSLIAVLTACSDGNEEITLTNGVIGCRNQDDAARMYDLEHGHDMGALVDFDAHSSCEAATPGTKIIIEERGLRYTRFHIKGKGQALITRERIGAE